MEKGLIKSVFGVPVFWDVVLYKKRIDDALSGVDLKSYTKNNQLRENDSKNSDWDCIVNTGHKEGLIQGNEDWVSVFLESINHEIFYYIREFKIDNGIEFVPKIEIWVNYYEHNNWQERHDHVAKDNVISFSYLHKSPSDSGNFRFHNPLPNMNSKHFEFLKRYEEIPPLEGSLIMFPSWLEHSVSINKSEEHRISISGNIFFDEGL